MNIEIYYTENMYDIMVNGENHKVIDGTYEIEDLKHAERIAKRYAKKYKCNIIYTS